MSKKVKEKLNAEEEYQQIRDEFIYKKLDRVLQALKGKTVMIDTWNGIMIDRYCDSFNYNYSLNCENQKLLNLKNSEDSDLSDITIKLEDIEDIEVVDNLNDNGELDEFDNEYYVENIIVYLEIGLVIRLELQW